LRFFGDVGVTYLVKCREYLLSVQKETTECRFDRKKSVTDIHSDTSNMSTHLRPKHEITSSSGSSSGPTETTMAQMNPPITVTKTSQLRQSKRVSDTMFAKCSLSFNSARVQSITKAIVGFITKDMRALLI